MIETREEKQRSIIEDNRKQRESVAAENEARRIEEEKNAALIRSFKEQHQVGSTFVNSMGEHGTLLEYYMGDRFECMRTEVQRKSGKIEKAVYPMHIAINEQYIIFD